MNKITITIEVDDKGIIALDLHNTVSPITALGLFEVAKQMIHEERSIKRETVIDTVAKEE